MLSKSLVVLAASASAFATVYVTSPTATASFTGGQQATISWQDDGKAPSLKDFGPAKVSIYAGNAQQQTLLQQIVASVDVGSTQAIQFTPDPSIGPNSSEYFIRFESLGLKDPAAPQYPALAFSAKFTMSGMTGQFSPAVQAQIQGQSTAPLAGATAAPTGATTQGLAASTTSRTSTGSATGTKSSSTTKPTNAAASTKAGWLGIVIGAVLGASMF
ncbi:putative ser-Thr-rich glycosyl-phosphatidyl-inositol-anchored membrane family protein [Lyophyllum shimeji]|uniref:Ser-Thr-rich glycosyl-phosphatidyl-inositol-anchored membrane family protein n=1 Tax=Lyophyllum shimeji TaxID=47721 RepID=A0A9P3UNM1_LYOSH|nr:putative ser-Thr-rich glycosyl-phosphatidyl-inositol-anchored membrane family protein [Lyophyllum shimeji]